LKVFKKLSSPSSILSGEEGIDVAWCYLGEHKSMTRGPEKREKLKKKEEMEVN
jgi:hypothetical protein